MQVRTASARDLDRVAALASLLFAQHAEGDARFALVPGGEDALRDLLAGFLHDPEQSLLVVAEAPGGSRSSPTSTPCRRECWVIRTWSRSAATRSSGAASTSRSRTSLWGATRSTLAAQGRVGPVSSV